MKRVEEGSDGILTIVDDDTEDIITITTTYWRGPETVVLVNGHKVWPGEGEHHEHHRHDRFDAPDQLPIDSVDRPSAG